MESLYCMPETNVTLYMNYVWIKKSVGQSFDVLDRSVGVVIPRVILSPVGGYDPLRVVILDIRDDRCFQ